LSSHYIFNWIGFVDIEIYLSSHNTCTQKFRNRENIEREIDELTNLWLVMISTPKDNFWWEPKKSEFRHRYWIKLLKNI